MNHQKINQFLKELCNEKELTQVAFVLGTLLTGPLYASRYMSKAKTYKMRLLKKIRGTK